MSEGVHVVAWVDNFNKLKYAPDPQAHTRNLDATAVAFLHVPHFCKFSGHVTLSNLIIRMVPNAEMLSKASDDLMRHIKDQVVQVPSREDLRIPLDIRRYAVRSLPWKPVTLGPWRIGGGIGLLHCLDYLRGLQPLVAPRDMPLLVDMDIFHRLQKLLYSNTFNRWDMAAYLGRHPLIWGVWHSYKHCVMSVYQVFLPIFGYIVTNLDTDCGGRASLRPKLIFVERLMLGLYLQPQLVRQQLHATVAEMSARAEESPTPARCQAARAIESLHSLMATYVPTLFLLGYLVRQCTWAGRDSGSGVLHRKVLLYSTALLQGLRHAKTRNFDPYVNAQIPAMLAAVPTADTLAAAGHSEESCEAMLSRFAAHWANHPSATTCEAVADLFVTLPDVSETVADRRNTVRQELVDEIGNLIPKLGCSLILNDISWHFYRSATPAVHRSAPFTLTTRFPKPTLRMTVLEAHKASMDCMVNLVGDACCDPDMEVWLDANVPIRRPDVQAQRVKLMQTVLPTNTHVGRVVHKPDRAAAAEDSDVVDEDV